MRRYQKNKKEATFSAALLTSFVRNPPPTRDFNANAED
jgi:hypothetical protein